MTFESTGSNMELFETKRKLLFESLDDAGKTLKGTKLDQTKKKQKLCVSKNYSQSDSALIKLRGKESIFKKPELPISKCLKPRVIPDYKINPHKWKKYSLDDVDISDKTNTSAAFAFLKELEQRKQSELEELSTANPMDTDTTKKLLFKKSFELKNELKLDEDHQKPILKGFKVLMPEYVIGQKPDKRKKRPTLQGSKNVDRQLQLSHLIEEDDEVTEDGDI